MIHESGNRLRDKDPGKTKTFERDPSQSNRIGSRSRMARGLRKALDEHSRRDESAKRESIIFGELGTMATGGENVPEIREKLAPPGKNPSKSAP
jgi:hypothetical protein